MQRLSISVVIPTYNRAGLVTRAIDSVLAGSSADDEVIVVDDGSTDTTLDVLRAYGDRIRVIRGRHAGAGSARNLGIRAATRPLIAFLDSDDAWMPDKIALQRALMERRPDILFCFSDFDLRLDDAETPGYLCRWHKDDRSWSDILGAAERYSTIAPLPAGRDDFDVHCGTIYLAEMERDYIAAFTLMARRESTDASFVFAEDVVTFEDWEYFARLARAGRAAYMSCATAWQYAHAGPRLTDASVVARAGARLRILERVWGSDSAFLRAHRERYERVIRRYHLQRAACLLHQGQAHLARADLRACSNVPLRYRVAASLPGPMTGGLLRLRRKWRETRADR